MSSTCLQCGREFSRLRLALHWPTSITCGHCRARHAYTYGHLIGLAFLAVLLPACLLPMIVAGYFMQVEGQIHSIGPMYTVVQLSTLVLMTGGLCLVQGSLLKRFGRLHAAGKPKA